MKDIFQDLSTEKRNTNIDTDYKTFNQLVDSFINEEKKLNKVLKANSKKIAKASEIFFQTFSKGSRIFFIGAGTSGRLGILEAAECPPTFGTSPGDIVGLIAGGNRAVFRAVEGAEDSKTSSKKDLVRKGFSKRDLLIGISASGKTNYVLSAMDYAKKINSKTIFISCNKPRKKISKFDLILEVGPELVAGSTRLKSGTITKNVLNIITTTAMIKAEKVFKNMMVNISPSTNKLRARAVRNVSTILNLEKPASLKLLESSNWNMKVAIIMFKKNISYSKARNLSSNLSFKELFKK
jgi:N-acetylmuramic acid 6-phosphate etherase